MTDEETVEKRRSRWWWALAIIPVSLLLLVLVVALLPHILTGERVRAEAVSALTELLGAPVSIGRVEYGLLSGVEIDQLVVGPPPGFEDEVLSVQHVAVRYELGFSRRIVLTEVRAEAPVLTLETRGGRTNVDAILAHLEGKDPEPELQPAAEKGALLPVDLDLERFLIAPITLRLTGEGPNAELKRAFLSATGHAGREKLDLKAELRIDPDHGTNLSLSQPEMTVTATVFERIYIAVQGRTDSGLALERAEVSVDGETRASGRWRGRELEPLVLAHDASLGVLPAEDRAGVPGLVVKLDGEPLLSAKAELDGIAALIEAFAGAPVVLALGDIGLVDRKRSGSTSLAVERATLPLDRLAPVIERGHRGS